MPNVKQIFWTVAIALVVTAAVFRVAFLRGLVTGRP